VTVSPVAATAITLNKTSMTLMSGASETLTATVIPLNATNKDVTWSISDNTIATVASGAVTANNSKAGTAVITATAGTLNATCSLTVYASIGGDVTLPGGIHADLPAGTVVDPDGTITLPPDKEGTLKLSGAEATLPGGTVIAPDGTIKLPLDKSSKMTTSGGVEIEFPGGTIIWPDETITMPPNKTAVVTTSDGAVNAEVSGSIKVEPDGTAVLSNATVVTSDGTVIEFFNGAITEDVDEKGTLCLFIAVGENKALVTYPDGKTVTVSNGSTIKLNPDGSISTSGSRSGGGGGCNVGLALLTTVVMGSAVVFKRKYFMNK
jgi:hypothetical protein